MSYDQPRRHGRGGYHNRRDRDDRRPPPETEEQKLKNLIIKIGDSSVSRMIPIIDDVCDLKMPMVNMCKKSSNILNELQNVANILRSALGTRSSPIAEGFRIRSVSALLNTIGLL